MNDSKWIRTHNHVVRKRTLNHLAKHTQPLNKKKEETTFDFSQNSLTAV